VASTAAPVPASRQRLVDFSSFGVMGSRLLFWSVLTHGAGPN
jgi:hypothetical protein